MWQLGGKAGCLGVRVIGYGRRVLIFGNIHNASLNADFRGGKPTDILSGLYRDLSGIAAVVVSRFLDLGPVVRRLRSRRCRAGEADHSLISPRSPSIDRRLRLI